MKLKKEIKDKINYLFDVLDKNGIGTMTVSFYGSGDDGNMEVSELLDKENVWKNLNTDEPTIYDCDLWELICFVSDHILDQKGIDYANGQGNNGCISYSVNDKTIDIGYQVITDAEYKFSV